MQYVENVILIEGCDFMSGDRLDLLARIQDLEEENKMLKERATPKKVIKLKKSQYGYIHQCPSCKQLVGTIVYDVKVRRITEIEHDNYCCSCGQALDWSDEE